MKQPVQQMRQPAEHPLPSVPAQSSRELAPLVVLSPLTLIRFCQQYLTPAQIDDVFARDRKW